MSADHVAVLVAAGAACLAAVGSVVAVVLLGRRVRDLGRLVEDLRRETLPLVRDARVVIEEAATEMVRVGDVLGRPSPSRRLSIPPRASPTGPSPTPWSRSWPSARASAPRCDDWWDRRRARRACEVTTGPDGSVPTPWRRR